MLPNAIFWSVSGPLQQRLAILFSGILPEPKSFLT